MEMEKELQKQQFHIQLLLSISNVDAHHLVRLLVESGITEKEYQLLLKTLDKLEQTFYEWKEEGYLNFEPLLVRFVGELCEKLNPERTMLALSKEGMYAELVEEFIHIHFKYKKNDME
ncbi:DUF1878 family protein [Gracilibacillus oryzae]|uniref:DUF1878 family protein n=1 Tax=Gracilibacillus oryzae TaxID=1672701 RepID=A0A7C8GWH8_9BACI|nr:DUF1878 family protein [Gracilibacillus oryzae]KAB8139027.1 DUF1878 family protein [Gracilibacillus oryzae]